MKDKIVFINQSTGYLMIDIVNAFASQCKETALIAGSIKENERSLNSSTKVDKIVEYIHKGEDKCYAENALNEIFPSLNIKAFSYENY